MSGIDGSTANCACPGESAAPAEVHVAGVLVHARPESVDDVRIAITLLPNGEVTHHAEDGRMVAVLEAPTSRVVMQQLEAIRAVRGVLNVALVYQHAEAADDMDREIEA